VLLAWLLASVALVLQTKGRDLALEEAWRRVESSGAAGVAEIGARVQEVAALARTLAETIEHIPLREDQVMASLPSLIDFQGDRAIAGGGFWPEPFAFDPARERRSFFWGRNETGRLQYFDDYNVSDAGYHGAEWYVPARYLARGRVYWSRTYTDPFTRQPMVTCTAPVFRDARLHGVVTVDLRLEGLQALADAVKERTGGYAFVLDPYGRFITFPEPERVMRSRGERLTLQELAAKERAFDPLARAVMAMDPTLLAAPTDTNGRETLARTLDSASEEIDASQAAVVAALLQGGPLEASQVVRRVTLTTDALLGEACEAFVFHVPETYWRLVVVKPVSEGAAVASRLIGILTGYLALGLTLALGIAYLAVERFLISPLRRTTAGVREAGRLVSESRFVALRDHHVAGSGVREVEMLTEVLNTLASTVGRVTGDLDRARGAAESASRAKSELLAAMSHELRTPLNQIIGYAELLQEAAEDAGREDDLQDLRRIHGAASHLLRMVDDALAISQMESDRIELAVRPFDPWQLAEEVVTALRPLAEKNANELAFARPPGGGSAESDPDKLRVCLGHLVQNACSFTSRGHVDVSGELEEAQGERLLVFRVRDNGPGIPEERQDEIFERFTQLDRSSTRTQDGAGLGLAVTRGYVEALRGSVSVESEPGKGSVFTLRVPAGRAGRA